MDRIGFIGLGIMGSRMAANLLKAGHPLVVYNRSKDKAEDVVRLGAELADSPEEVGRQCSIVFTMLSNPDAVGEMASRFLPAMKPDALWVDCSTVNPAFSREMAAKARPTGVAFLDAPVAGSKIPAENGQLVFLVGGDSNELEKCRPVLLCMGKTIHHVGDHGMGSALKIVINSILAASMLAFSEGLVLGEAMGIDRGRLFDVLLSLPVTAPFIGLKRKKIENRDYSPEFPLQWMHKDLTLVQQTAREHRVRLPFVDAAASVYELAKEAGLGEEDLSAVYAYLSGSRR